MYLLLSGRPPFYHPKSDQEIFAKIRKGKYEMPPDLWDPISNEAKQLIFDLLMFCPEDRLEAEQALLSDWFDIVTPENPSLGEGIVKRLEKFAKQSRFKKIALTVVAK